MLLFVVPPVFIIHSLLCNPIFAEDILNVKSSTTTTTTTTPDSSTLAKIKNAPTSTGTTTTTTTVKPTTVKVKEDLMHADVVADLAPIVKEKPIVVDKLPIMEKLKPSVNVEEPTLEEENIEKTRSKPSLKIKIQKPKTQNPIEIGKIEKPVVKHHMPKFSKTTSTITNVSTTKTATREATKMEAESELINSTKKVLGTKGVSNEAITLVEPPKIKGPLLLLAPLLQGPSRREQSTTTTTTESPFHTYNPLNLKMLLFTKSNPKNGYLLVPGDKKTIIGAKQFIPNAKIRVIIHGVYDGMSMTGWMNVMKKKFLSERREDENVILVDWTKGAATNNDDQLVTNARMMGTYVYMALKDLIEEKDAKPEDVHLIVHGAASFAADLIGQRIKGIGRITGLDPGGPSFDKLPIALRLDKTDAQFVDVIHTDVANDTAFNNRGTSLPIGHIDFFPNGGKNQPGCTIQRLSDLISKPILEGVRLFVACHHYRSIDYFIHSIDEKDLKTCKYLAYKCDVYEGSMRTCHGCGKEGKDCAEMGLNSIKYHDPKISENRLMYIKTHSRAPYCQYHYGVNIEISDKSAKLRGGSIVLDVIGKTGVLETRYNGGSNGFESGGNIQYITTNLSPLGKLEKINLAWAPAFTWSLFTGPAFRIKAIKFSELSTLAIDRTYEGRMFCPTNSTIISPFLQKTFTMSPETTCKFGQ